MASSLQPRRVAVDRPSLCISVVSHHQGHLVKSLLHDLQRINLLSEPQDELALTINVPEDETFLAPFNSLPVRVLRNDAPKGFGANHNAACMSSRCQVVLILNPDIRITRFDVRSMLEFLNEPQAGLWAPKVLSPSGSVEDSARRFPTIPRLLRRRLLTVRSPDYTLDTLPLEVDWVAGMFMAMKRDLYVRLSGFDERYFMYMEDADICRRLRRLGWRIVCDPREEVIHDAQRASHRSLTHLRWHLRSGLRFFLGI